MRHDFAAPVPPSGRTTSSGDARPTQPRPTQPRPTQQGGARA